MLSIRGDEVFTRKSPRLELKGLRDTHSSKPSHLFVPYNQMLLFIEVSWSLNCVLGRRGSEVTARPFNPVVAAAGLALRRQKILEAVETICFSHYLLNLQAPDN